MRKYLSVLTVLCMAACGHRKNIPDVSGIPVNLNIERFDQAFFRIDSNHIKEGLFQLNQQYPYFLTDFTANILGAGPLSDTSATAFLLCRQFMTSYMPVKDSIEEAFRDLSATRKELEKSFQFVKYYFPDYKLPPKVVSYIGPFDAPGVALTRYTLAIGLQLFAGKAFSFYNSSQGQELFPIYISRRFEPAYITPNCMKALAEDIYPDESAGKPLVEEMIEKGKYWYLLDAFLPETTDSLKTGFTQKQLNWCKANEGQIWNYLLQSDLFTIDPELIKNYLGDAPYTQGMPDVSPGNIGQWVGWQIVLRYAEEHTELKPADLIKIPAKKIFNEAKYKPK